MAQELEIKLGLAQPDLDRAVAWLLDQPHTSESDTLHLGNTYYDTPACDLNRQKTALRIRRMGDRYTQTLKTRGEFVDGAHRRQEWEWPLMGKELKMGLLADTPVGHGVNFAELQPVFETNFERRVVIIKQVESLIEVAIDSGEVQAGGQSCPLNEVEFELKAGDASALLTWARRLADEVPVFLNLISKAEQGYALAGLYQPVAPGEEESLVNRVFHGLSTAWLSGVVDPSLTQDLEELQSRESLPMALLSDLAWLQERLQAGETVAELAAGSTRLGRLQLALLAH